MSGAIIGAHSYPVCVNNIIGGVVMKLGKPNKLFKNDRYIFICYNEYINVYDNLLNHIKKLNVKNAIDMAFTCDYIIARTSIGEVFMYKTNLMEVYGNHKYGKNICDFFAEFNSNILYISEIDFSCNNSYVHKLNLNSNDFETLTIKKTCYISLYYVENKFLYTMFRDIDNNNSYQQVLNKYNLKPVGIKEIDNSQNVYNRIDNKFAYFEDGFYDYKNNICLPYCELNLSIDYVIGVKKDVDFYILFAGCKTNILDSNLNLIKCINAKNISDWIIDMSVLNDKVIVIYNGYSKVMNKKEFFG